jgi:hypothetical protein
MTDQQLLALQAMSDAQHILEGFLQPRPHNDKRLLERLVDVLERPDVVLAVDRLHRANDGQKKPAGITGGRADLSPRPSHYGPQPSGVAPSGASITPWRYG